MHELQQYVDRAKESLYFSGAKIDCHLKSFIEEQAAACEALGREYMGRFRHLFLVGGGGSLASMQTAKYVLDGLLSVPTDVVASYQLIWREPRLLDKDALVFFASYSGETEDTVAALRFAKQRGAHTVTIVAKSDSTMAHEADVVIPYDNGAIYEIPIAALIFFACGQSNGTQAETALGRLRD